MPRAGLLDPQGQAVEHALTALGFAEARRRCTSARPSSSRSTPQSRDEAEARARAMCDRLLANPVTEDYLVEVEALMLRVAVVRFPGSNCDCDTLRAARAGRRRRLLRLAPGHRPAGRRRRDPARRVQLRRLPPLRRDRPVQPDHAGGAAPRRGRRAGARHLQRLPDPVRGAACCPAR